MRWPKVPLEKVAPPKTTSQPFSSNQIVWQLTLDQIEGDTGNILAKKYGVASNSGNSTFYFDSGNVLYSKLRPYLNKVVSPDEPGIATTELIPLRPDPKLLHPHYLAYYLRSPDFVGQASHHVAGAKMPRVVMDWFWKHEIPLPSLSEQRRIVEILDEADRIRRLRKEANQKAERILPALFIKMFGDPAMNPKGWPLKTIGALTSLVTSGATPRGGAEVYVREGPYFIRSQNVLMNRLNLSNAARITEDMHQRMSHTWVSIGDVLLNITGASIGRVARVKELDGNANVSQHVCIIRPDQSEVNPTYLSFGLSLPFHQLAIKNIQVGASRQALNHVQVRALKVMIPPNDLQKIFSLKADEIEHLLGQVDSSVDRLERLVSNLMQHAFSGQLATKGGKPT